MATQPQPALSRTEINRQNAQHSTGPQTPEGKQRIRTNALKHGLTAKDIFLADGESQAYETLLARLTAKWQPVTPDEQELVLSLRDAQWRKNSIPALHINLLTLSTTEHMEAYAEFSDNPAYQRCAAQAAGYRANARLFDQLSRHEGRLARMIEDLEQRLTLIHEARLAERKRAALAELQSRAQQPSAPATKQSQPPAPSTPQAAHDPKVIFIEPQLTRK